MTSPIPGPYFIDEPRAAICSRCERTGQVLTLCMFTEWGERDRATARAIVASLEMLAALRLIIRHPLIRLTGDVEAVVLGAIAKAEGRA